MYKNILFIVAIAAILVGCVGVGTDSAQIEHNQQEAGVTAILENQPVPDLGGFSFERQIVSETYLARNKSFDTYTYVLLEYTGQVMEICPSKGYPIPYSTELTNPTQLQVNYVKTQWGSQWVEGPIGNPEPNGLYPPATADATLVTCINPDGSISPTYWETKVFAVPYRLKADITLNRTDDTQSFTVKGVGK